jgi:hypothetical protein
MLSEKKLITNNRSVSKQQSKSRLLSEAFNVDYSNEKLQSLLDNDEPIFLTALIQRANAKNQNNRIYPKEVLKREIDKYIIEFVNKGNALGELDHPDVLVVEYKTASHKIHKIWWEGDDVMARIEILSGKFFPCANILRGALKNKIPIGFSSRGFGSEIQLGEDTFEVEDDFQLVCWDAVVNPSTHGAFGLLTEAKINRNYVRQHTMTEINNLVHYILK